ncbi:MAG: tyrosine-type recombinase/integrase, partial [Desulfobulbaceae bacterium]|nr:tyrosine-type recombinase/integrase [Desulfobulbaceae bacterium]
AMVHIAYTMALRPQEISRLTLDDIAFSKAEMNVRYRKAGLPVTMPIPQKTLKAIVAYLVGGRLENDCRELFLQCCRPYRPVSSPTVCYTIKSCMQKAGLPEEATAYWLRHYGERYKMVREDRKPAIPGSYSSILSPFYH